jgi:hypothetical protein
LEDVMIALLGAGIAFGLAAVGMLMCSRAELRRRIDAAVRW